MIELVDGAYYLAIWFVAGDMRDWLAVAWITPEGERRFDMRFRYYATPDGVFDGKDKRSERNMRWDNRSEDQVLKDIANLIDSMIEGGFARPDQPRYEVVIQGDATACWARIKDLPFMHWMPVHPPGSAGGKDLPS